MKALLFGADGQDGPYIAESCRARGLDPVSVTRAEGDVSDFAVVDGLVRRHRPEVVFQLAAISTTRHDALFENHGAIATGTLNVLESVHRSGTGTKVFVVGSAVQFLNSGMPISEETPFVAQSPYAVARIHSVFAARYYRSLGVRSYVGYLFNHESPNRTPGHVSRDVVDAVARIAEGRSTFFEIGDLSTRKEWTFAGDIAEAILTLVHQDEIHEAVIGSGETHSIEEWVGECFSLRGLDWRKYVRRVSGFKAEYQTLASDPARIRSLGWRPRVSFHELAAMMSGL